MGDGPPYFLTSDSQSRLRFPVSVSITEDGAGPIPRQVVVPGSIWVKPLSLIRAKGRRSSLDFLSN